MKEYIKTDQQLHWLCQTIAKANRSFVPSKADDSHTNLYFDSLGNRIDGRWIDTEKGKIMFTLNLSNLQFEWLNSAYRVVSSFKTTGKKIASVEKEIADQLVEMGMRPNGFTDKLHYETPDYSFVSEAIHAINEQDLEEWKDFRNLANELSLVLLGFLQIEGEIRIWPHHFDTGIYAVSYDGMGIGFGLAMSDKLAGVPYFYMSGYPASGSLEFKDLPSFSKGKWEIGVSWKGAVLPLSELKQLPKKEKYMVINDYLLKAVNWFLTRK